MWPHRRQPIRLLCPWDSPGRNTGVGCHFLLQCMKGKSESKVAQSCPNRSDPMDCSPLGSSAPGILLAWVLEWVTIAFSAATESTVQNCHLLLLMEVVVMLLEMVMLMIMMVMKVIMIMARLYNWSSQNLISGIKWNVYFKNIDSWSPPQNYWFWISEARTQVWFYWFGLGGVLVVFFFLM